MAGQGGHPESTPTLGSFTLLQYPQLWGLVPGTDRALPPALSPQTLVVGRQFRVEEGGCSP